MFVKEIILSYYSVNLLTTKRCFMKKLVKVITFISLLLLALGTTYTTIIIDGINDFEADEALTTTSSFATYYATWDVDYIYLGGNNSNVSANSSQRFMYFYIDSDPQIDPTSGTGTTTGLTYNTQQPNLPFTANYHFRWRTDNAYMNLQTWNGSAWVDGEQTGIQAYQSGNYVEFRIPRANIGLPTQIYLCGAMINEVSGGEWTFFQIPADGHTDGYDRDFVSRFSFILTSGISPNDPNNVNAPLPVELTSFSATKLNNYIKLNWQTATELNNYGFEVERKFDVKEQSTEMWNKIGFLLGSGNSNSIKNYEFVDRDIKIGKYSYRLKQIDTDGRFEYSKVVEIDLGKPMQFYLSQNYPNPFNPKTFISYQLPVSSEVILVIYDELGNEITTLVNENKSVGSYSVEFDASSLSNGVYFYRLQAGSFVQTRKMILLK